MSEIKEAEAWLDGAKSLFNSGSAGEEKYTVVVSMCVHAIIRANDALTLRYLFETAKRHEDAPSLFLKLVEQGKIAKKYDPIRREVLIPAMRIKSLVDYRGTFTSKKSAEDWIGNTERFINIVKECLGNG